MNARRFVSSGRRVLALAKVRCVLPGSGECLGESRVRVSDTRIRTSGSRKLHASRCRQGIHHTRGAAADSRSRSCTAPRSPWLGSALSFPVAKLRNLERGHSGSVQGLQDAPHTSSMHGPNAPSRLVRRRCCGTLACWARAGLVLHAGYDRCFVLDPSPLLPWQRRSSLGPGSTGHVRRTPGRVRSQPPRDAVLRRSLITLPV